LVLYTKEECKMRTYGTRLIRRNIETMRLKVTGVRKERHITKYY